MANHIVDFKFEVIRVFATLSMLFYDLTNDILKINWNRLDVTSRELMHVWIFSVQFFSTDLTSLILESCPSLVCIHLTVAV